MQHGATQIITIFKKGSASCGYIYPEKILYAKIILQVDMSFKYVHKRASMTQDKNISRKDFPKNWNPMW